MPTDAQTLIDLVATQGYEKLSRRELIECILAAAQGGSSGTPAYQDMQVAWTPRNLKLGEMFGYIAYSPAVPLIGLTTLDFLHVSNAEGYSITGSNSASDTLTSLTFPKLTVIGDAVFGSNFGFNVSTCNALQTALAPLLEHIYGEGLFLNNNIALSTINFDSLISVGDQLNLNACDVLAAISLPALVSVSGNVSANTCPMLTTVSFPSFLPSNGKNVQFIDCALTDLSVNHILARAVANAGYVSGGVNLSGGTSAAPTGQGIIDKATLNGRLAGLAITN